MPWIERNRQKQEKIDKKDVSKLSDEELAKKGKKARAKITYKKPKTEVEKTKKKKLEDIDSTYYEEKKRRDSKRYQKAVEKKARKGKQMGLFEEY